MKTDSMKYLFAVFTLSVFSSTAQTDTLNQKDANGWKQGYWIVYGKDMPEKGYCDTCKIEEGPYLNDRKNGEWKLYHQNGFLRLSGPFENGRPKGPYVKYDQAGVMIQRGNIYESTCNGSILTDCVYVPDSGDNTQQPIVKIVQIDSVDIADPVEWLSPHTSPSATGGYMIETSSFRPHDFNHVYTGTHDLWLSGTFKNGYLWDGRQYIYDQAGELVRTEIWKNGKYRRDEIESCSKSVMLSNPIVEFSARSALALKYGRVYPG
jgi:hypothetical protein